MERSLRRYIVYIGLIGVWAVLLCGCGKQTEQVPPFSDMSGMQGEVMTGTDVPAVPSEVPSNINAGTPTSTPVATNNPAVTPTSTPVPTNSPTPTPVITDPYDGRFWTGKFAEDTELLLTKRQIREQNEKDYQ